jgi:ABC-type uncharacterized transport system substrate-binding protein
MKKAGALSILFGVVLAVAVMAEAQQPKKVLRIGYLTLRAAPSELDETFKRELRQLGYIDGQNIAIEYRWAAGKVDHLAALAEELVRRNVDVIVASTTPAVNAAKIATKTIPIVMATSADPVRTGLVASLARPGGNITGVSLIMPELAGKRIELLKEVLPKLSRVAFLAYGPGPGNQLFVKEAQESVEKFGMKFQPVVIGGPEEIEDVLSNDQRAGGGSNGPPDLCRRSWAGWADRGAGDKKPFAHDLGWISLCGSRRLDLLRTGLSPVDPPRCYLRG